LAQSTVSLLHLGKGRTSKDLEGDKQPPAPEQDLESNWVFQERILLLSICAHGAQDKYAI